MRSTLTRALAAAATPLALLAVLSGCSSSSGRTGAAPAATAGSSAQAAPGTVVITGDDMFRFNPMSATAPAGPVTIRFEGMGSYPHNIHFTTLHKTSASTTGGITGNTVTLELGTLKPGSYPFICDYHVGADMKGVLTVR
ncbi:MAG: cupredoxin domain-containing protein [Mycobacteriales bacterium]